MTGRSYGGVKKMYSTTDLLQSEAATFPITNFTTNVSYGNLLGCKILFL